LDADPPAQGVKIARRITLKLDAMAIDGGDGGQMKDVQAFAGPRLSAPTQSGSTRLSREW
jgi:hypothetical protein